jgi:hypothetical protein
VNAICERIHQVLGTMMHTSELDMADSVDPADIDTFAIHSTYHTVLKASPGAAIFGQDMLFGIPFVADWKQIGVYRQNQTDRSNKHENNKHVDYDHKVGDKILIQKNGILHKAESVGRRGTNQLRFLERYLDVLVKQTTEDPAPSCLSRRHIVKMI